MKRRGVTGSQKNLLSTTIHITTNITSFDVDLIVYDGLLASYISNVILESPSQCSSGVTSRQIDKEHMIWGTRLLPVRSDAGSNAVYMNVDMGYLHPGEHHYQTLVLYNRNPVTTSIQIHSPTVAGVSLRPIYRAILANQTLTNVTAQARRVDCPSPAQCSRCRRHCCGWAPWEYVVFLLDVAPEPARGCRPARAR